MLYQLLREIHRHRKLIREAQEEIDRAPKVLKARQAKLATTEKALTDARETLKKTKAALLELESRVKSSNQQLAKYEKQLETADSPKVSAAKEIEIANTKTLIAQIEDQSLETMTDIEERTAKIPDYEAAAVKARAEFAQFETDAAEKLVRMKETIAVSTKALAAEEAKFPDLNRSQYDRVIKAYGADGLAAIEGSSCTQCRCSITSQILNDIQKGHFECCRTCGRILYLTI
jgi:uncharacterized protein